MLSPAFHGLPKLSDLEHHFHGESKTREPMIPRIEALELELGLPPQAGLDFPARLRRLAAGMAYCD